MNTPIIQRNTPSRQSNFELLRILCMLMVICGHLCKVHDKTDFIDASILSIAKCFSICAVNCFIILSGYFSIKFKIDKIIKLIFQVLFYSVTIYSFTVLIGWHTINPIKDFLMLFPIFSNHYWFVTAYFILYFLSPYLNKSCEILSQEQFRFVLILGFILFYVWPTLAFLVNAHQLISDAGYGMINFSYLYMLGRYIKIYKKDQHSSYFYLALYIGICLLLFGTHTGLTLFLGFQFDSFYSYNTIFVLGSAITLFMFFEKIRLQSQIINNLAKTCLTAYLLHCGPYIWGDFCMKVLHFQDYHRVEIIPFLFLVPPTIYLLSYAIENLRINILSKFEQNIISKLQGIKLISSITNHYNTLK